jgi:hypothetical protein
MSFDEISDNRDAVDRLLMAIGEFKGWSDGSHVFVSDSSQIGDFNLSESELNALIAKINVSVSETDYIYEVAIRMSLN